MQWRSARTGICALLRSFCTCAAAAVASAVSRKPKDPAHLLSAVGLSCNSKMLMTFGRLAVSIMAVLIAGMICGPHSARGAAKADQFGPLGVLDRADGEVVSGWVKSPNNGRPVSVGILVDGVHVDDVIANLYQPDVGNYAFSWRHAPFGPGLHKVEAYAVGVDHSGKPAGRKAMLNAAPKYFDVGCQGVRGSGKEWCGVKNYWINRQQDTKLLWNEYIKIGIDNSYGGAVMQLYSKDRSINLIEEHGGAAIQLSLWGYDSRAKGAAWFGTDHALGGLGMSDPTPYASRQACLQRNADCRPNPFPSSGAQIADGERVKSCFKWGAGAPWNPLQAQGPDCGWDSPENDVQYQRSLPDGGWEIRYSNPFNFTKTSRFEGLTFDQKVTLGDIYAKIEYSISYSGHFTTAPHPQEIPAIFTGNGVNYYFYYYGGSTPFIDVGGPVTKIDVNDLLRRPVNSRFLRFPGQGHYAHKDYMDNVTEGWWGACDRRETHCVTVATFDPSANEAALTVPGKAKLSGYISLLGYFGLHSGFQRDVTIYIFPYKYDQVIAGKSIRERIFELRAPLQ